MSISDIPANAADAGVLAQANVPRDQEELRLSRDWCSVFPEKTSVVPNQFMDPSHFPIIMGVDGGPCCLSCSTSAQPTFMLEDKKIMDLYQNSWEAERFTFTCSASSSTLRFELVAFPGWYLSTSPRNDQPLWVTNCLGEAEITNFYFKKV
ncbi:unnamed protein product [Lepidochelys olivacea]